MRNFKNRSNNNKNAYIKKNLEISYARNYLQRGKEIRKLKKALIKGMDNQYQLIDNLNQLCETHITRPLIKI